jgi:competence protein ComEC
MRNGLLDATADMSGQARGLVPGIAVGDDSRLPVQLDQHFRSTSLTHLTAVSGGHFAIVLTMLTAAAAALHLPRGLRATLIAACAGAFVLLVRPEPSVLRAAAMCAVTLLAIILGRRAASIPALATCTIVLLAGDPWLARSYGFALSCAATAGLVLLTPALTARLTPWIGRTAAFAMAVPWAAQLACGPIVMMFAPGIPTTSIPANLLASPAVAPATLLGLASALISPWCAWGARALAWLASGATWWIAQVATRCANLPGARLPWPGGIGGALLLAGFTAAGLAALLRKPPADGWAAGHPLNLPAHYARSSRQLRETHRAIRARQQAGMTSRRDRRMVTALAACLGVIVLAIGLSLHGAVRGSRAASTPANWQIVMCDVGQGDSLLVRSGSASAVVVDVGPHEPAESGGRSGDAGACLTRLGVTKVDLLVLTHFHADHVGGLAGLLVGRDVERVLVSALPQPSDGAHSVSSLLAAAGIAVEVPQTGLSGTVGGGSDGWAVDWTVVRADGALARPAVPPAPTASTDSDPDSSPHPGAGAACCSTDGLTGDPNDASVALSITSTGPGGKVSLLALGDLEEDGQNALLQALRQARSPLLDGVDVVKIAHHGSASQSSGLAQALHPRLALIGVGARNTYGHPTQEALTLYEEHGATILRTDLCGTGAVVVGGGRLSYACMAR